MHTRQLGDPERQLRVPSFLHDSLLASLGPELLPRHFLAGGSVRRSCKRDQVGPWVPVIPVEVGPYEAGGDTRGRIDRRVLISVPSAPRVACQGRYREDTHNCSSSRRMDHTRLWWYFYSIDSAHDPDQT